jgi:hypothetical protein
MQLVVAGGSEGQNRWDRSPDEGAASCSRETVSALIQAPDLTPLTLSPIC